MIPWTQLGEELAVIVVGVAVIGLILVEYAVRRVRRVVARAQARIVDAGTRSDTRLREELARQGDRLVKFGRDQHEGTRRVLEHPAPGEVSDPPGMPAWALAAHQRDAAPAAALATPPTVPPPSGPTPKPGTTSRHRATTRPRGGL